MYYPLKKGSYAKQAHLNLPANTYEDEHGRNGFYGKVSHLYRLNPPTSWTEIKGNLKPRAYDTNKINENNIPIKILYNNDVSIFTLKQNISMDYYFRNADGDELYFVHDGKGEFETDFGVLTFSKGDYLVIPRGTTYRVKITNSSYFLLVESYSEINQPDRGILGPNALYDPSVIEVPEPEPIIDGKEWELKIKRLNELTSVFYPFNPIDVVGWKGDLTAWKINIKDICPVISHRAHVPPSVHTSFLAHNFVVCSFVPRPLETEEGSLKVPFYHRNIDYDEVIFYHDGNFFSRDGIGSGMITFHPQGIHHGPHPKALKNSLTNPKKETDEYAVMIDTRYPLLPSDLAKNIEFEEYYMTLERKIKMENINFIESYDNVLSREYCEKLMSTFESSNRKIAGQTGFGVNKIAKDSLDITMNLYPEWKSQLDEIEAITRKYLVKYMRKYYHLMTGAVSLFIPNPDGGIIQVTPEVLDIINDDLFEGLMNKVYRFGTLNLQKYNKGSGGYHHWHSEIYPKKGDKQESLHRVLLYMFYLNDVEEGGETEFFYQNKKLKPKQGQLVIAPSDFTHTHKGHVPISNDKYILTSWVLFRREEEIYR